MTLEQLGIILIVVGCIICVVGGVLGIVYAYLETLVIIWGTVGFIMVLFGGSLLEESLRKLKGNK